MVVRSGTKVVKSLCNMCMQCCGIDAELAEGRLVKVTGMENHPFNHLCVKAQGIVDWLYSPERITTPLKRSNGGWAEISWDEAFDIISDKLGETKEKHGAKSLVAYSGNPFIGTHVGRIASRFCSVYGTPNYTSSASLCFTATGMGHGLTVSNRLLRLFPSFEGSRCIVVWGYNPRQSNITDMPGILAARKKGARLIVVDPRRTSLARDADIHAQIRPGTDSALALGMINVIIAEQLYDEAFVQSWAIGFGQLREHVKSYSPEEVAKITWVPAQMVREIARTYATSKPAAIAQGVGLDHCVGGVQTSRATATLMAITGNLDVPGGNVYNAPLKLTGLRVKGTVNPDEVIGAQYPIFNRFIGETTAAPVVDAILKGEPYPVKAMIVFGANPVLTWPNAGRVKEALSRLDFLVVSDLFMTETAKLADVFLPATTVWEGSVLKDYAFVGLPLVMWGQKVVEPLGNSMENWRIWAELGRRMGYADCFPWQSAEEFLATLLEASGITLQQLEEQPAGVFYADRERGQKYLEQGLSSPSGKVELFSQIMESYGYDPLAAFTEPLPALIDNPDLLADYPFILVTGTRAQAFTHSQHRNVARLKKLMPYPMVEINTTAAKELGIADSEPVVVESPRGSITLKAKVGDDIHPRVLSIPHGWDEANVNLLTDDEARDPISGYPGFKTVMCRVRKAEG